MHRRLGAFLFQRAEINRKEDFLLVFHPHTFINSLSAEITMRRCFAYGKGYVVELDF